jgi:hypothetical protein
MPFVLPTRVLPKRISTKVSVFWTFLFEELKADAMTTWLYITVPTQSIAVQDQHTVEPRFTNLIRSWRPFVNRNVGKPKLFFP